MRNIIIIGMSSDIGKSLAERYIRDSNKVLGTYRSSHSNIVESVIYSKVYCLYCDIRDSKDINTLCNVTSKYFEGKWDTIIFSVADMHPVSKFFSCKFEDWETSIDVNLVGQLRVLHALWKYAGEKPNVVFFSGMGTNNAVVDQSAICASKIALMKMVELLTYENSNLNAFIIGPGFVNTKIHQSTLQAMDKNSESYLKVKKWMDEGTNSTPMEDIYNNIEWCIREGRDVCGGRNFSTVHDCWGDPELADKLLSDYNMYKLRRYGNNWRERKHEG